MQALGWPARSAAGRIVKLPTATQTSRIVPMAKRVQVVLNEDVLSLGRDGDLVEVAPGYARNFLLPAKPCQSPLP